MLEWQIYGCVKHERPNRFVERSVEQLKLYETSNLWSSDYRATCSHMFFFVSRRLDEIALVTFSVGCEFMNRRLKSAVPSASDSNGSIAAHFVRHGQLHLERICYSSQRWHDVHWQETLLPSMKWIRWIDLPTVARWCRFSLFSNVGLSMTRVSWASRFVSVWIST